MSWLHRYHLRHYVANSIWILPAIGAVGAVGVVQALHTLESDLGWVSSVEPDTARAVLGTTAAALFTSVVFVCSSLLVAVQLASAALTPRIIALVFRDLVTRLSLALFVFTFIYSVAALVRIKATVPLLTVHSAGYLFVLNLCGFFYLIDHLGKTLRPSGALRTVGRLGRDVIESVYPRMLAEASIEATAETVDLTEGQPVVTIASPYDGVVLAFDDHGLVALATLADCVIEMVPQVGDHVAVGDLLFRVHAGSSPPTTALYQSVAVGQERTFRQDPAFAFRVMVDIASKALSPAINDPTTAVLALDQLHHLLRVVGGRRLDTGVVRDAAGRVRLVYRTPDWEDFVRLAVTEIRQFGGESIQVARRLRAMLENLAFTLPKSRAVLLQSELTLLVRSSERCFPDPEDRAMAEVSDYQGVGGMPERRQTQETRFEE